MRSRRNSIFTLKTKNHWLLGSFILTALLTLSVIYIPFLSNLFGLAPISFGELSIAFGLAAAVVPVFEGIKFLRRKFGKDE